MNLTRTRRATLTGALALATGCTVGLTSAPASAAPPSLPSTIALECPDLGRVVVHTHGSLAAATVDAGPVALAGAKVTASGAFGDVTDGTLSASALACAPVQLTGVRAGQVLGAGKTSTVGGASATLGAVTVQFGVSINADSVIASATNNPIKSSSVAQAVANDPAGYGPVEPFPSTWGMPGYLGSRGSIAAAYRAIGSRVIYSASSGTAKNVTASIVKVQIMATVMYQAQQAGRGLSSWEISQMVPMITQSDNGASSNLWNHVGGGPAVAKVLGLMGLRETVPGPGTYWGLTVTTAPDQVVLVDHFARANPVLSTTMRTYGLSLMRRVSSAQNWGVTAGPGTDNAVKNGWLPRADGWHVNSIGYLDDAPRAYVMAVLSQSPSASMSTLVARIEGASRLVWAHRAGVRGDWNGDGRADLAGVKNSRLVIWPSTGTRFGAPVTLGSGWSAMAWVGTPGDVNGDGITDVLAERRTDGHLLLYRGTGRLGGSTLGLAGPVDLGRGWGAFDRLITPGDVDADGRGDLLARLPNGVVYQYWVNASGAPRRVRTIATGWNTLVAILGSGDFNNDGRGDVIATARNANMYEYLSSGTRMSGAIGPVGSGWTGTFIASPGDVTGDGVSDLVRRAADGTCYLHNVLPGGKVTAGTPCGWSLAGYTWLF